MKALALLGTLKHAPEFSNTDELLDGVLAHLKNHGVETKKIRLVDQNIQHGLLTDMGDDWNAIAHELLAADIVIFATPIWWGQPSSLIQKIIERMDDIDNEHMKTGESKIYGKVAGIVITGHEDGALHVVATLAGQLTWFGFTMPPECAAYWVGEVGKPLAQSTESRRANKATQTMVGTMAHNLFTFAKILGAAKNEIAAIHSKANAKKMECAECKKAGSAEIKLPAGWRQPRRS